VKAVDEFETQGEGERQEQKEAGGKGERFAKKFHDNSPLKLFGCASCFSNSSKSLGWIAP
jgi:protein-arginine kinase activator protein McsA